MFEKFGDYMFYLLTTALKNDKNSNQFYIFCKVIGKLFDQTKQDIMKLRRESMILSSSNVMLQVHGQDREMYKYDGETDENFRNRLLMKAIIAEWAGSKKGIAYALQSVGYDDSVISPVWEEYPERWAEFFVMFQRDADNDSQINFKCIRREVMLVKQASALPYFRFIYTIVFDYENQEKLDCPKMTNRIYMNFWNIYAMLNGRYNLDGETYLDAELDLFSTKMTNRMSIETSGEIVSGKVIKDTMWYLDGTYSLSGERKLNAAIIEEVL